MNIIYSDALIIGGGLAGLRSAVACADKGLETIVLSLVPVKRSHSAAAQGGMQASVGNTIMSQGDNEDLHFEDTVKGSDWGCDQDVARMFVTTAPKAIRELASWGVPWSRIKSGPRTVVMNAKKVVIDEKKEADGLINSRNFGGTKKWRTCYTSDATGHSMLFAVANEAMRKDVTIQDRKEAISLIHKGDTCCGAIVRDLKDGSLTAYVAKSTMIASGGFGRIYRVTTNAVINEGIGHAIAIETGKVPLGNMEAVQFHPTPIVPSGILLTEGCRGDGGILRDKNGHRFMPDYEPEKKELASRDVVSRRMIEHIRKGYGASSPYGDHLWLDISILGREHIEKNLSDVQDISKSFNGIDPADLDGKGWMPVLPAQHYSMGGIRTDKTGQTYLKGLFSAGESCCWDLHGFNRLGGNSVSEAVVAGMIIGTYFAEFTATAKLDISTEEIQKELNKQDAYLNGLITATGSENIIKIKRQMQEIMNEKVGVFRNGDDLDSAYKELKELVEKSRNISLKNKSRGNNPELAEAYRTQKMLKLALCVTKGALMRTESRGAHYREDYLERDDKNWLNRTLAWWKNEQDIEPELTYEPLDIMKMEMPPGYRGYGKKGMTVEHDDTKIRLEEIEKIKEQNLDADRFELQELLLNFELPQNYKARNERIGD